MSSMAILSGVLVEYHVIEHYDGDAPEPFGSEWFRLAAPPKVGETVMLHWLDGRDAYPVVVTDVQDTELHVRAKKT